MIVNIRGKLIQKKPTDIIIDVGGLGYFCSISTNTYDHLPNIGKEISLMFNINFHLWHHLSFLVDFVYLFLA